MVTIRKEVKLPTDINLRRGSFKVSASFLDNATTEIFDFMSNFIIVKAEMNYFGNYIDYSAVSPLFDTIDEDAVVPEYDFEITRLIDGTIKIKTIRISGDGKKLLRKLRMMDG